MNKQFWGTLGGQLAAVLIQLAAVGVVALLVWKKIFGPQKTVEDVVERTIDAAVAIPGGVASVIGSTLRGESEAGYITDAQQRQRAAEQLAARRGS